MQNISSWFYTKIYSLVSVYFLNLPLPLKDFRRHLVPIKFKKYNFKTSRRKAESLIIEIIAIVIVNHLVI